MPGTEFTIGITALPEDDTFTEAMEHIGLRVSDFAPVYTALYEMFLRIESERFGAEGPGWEELADSTVARRGSAHPILDVTGELKDAFTKKGAKHALVEPLPDGLFMGADDWVLASVHQNGTERAGRDHNTHIPARPIVDIQEQDAELFSDILSDYFYEFGLSAEGADSGVFAASSEGL